ncbi:MAG: ISL3 family transposase [Oceanospirillaceae bacterium]|nr:ISL3 family transposase [Oceanospirillaceae bacterium]
MNPNPLTLLWEGFEIQSYQQISSDSLVIQLQPSPNRQYHCRHCLQSAYQMHDRSIRRIRERDIGPFKVWLDVPVARVACSRCGPRTERISWLPDRLRMTRSFMLWIEVLVQKMPVAHVARLTGVHWHTVKAIDYQRLKREQREPDRQGLKRLIMDEFALFKGHRYATVVVNADNQQLLWVGEGRSRAAVRPFFEWLGVEACEQIEAVAMDMNTAMDLEVQHHCRNARVVYDLFHVVAKFGREVVDRVRVDQANQLRHDKPGRKIIKRARWLLLRNANNLKAKQAIQLQELLQANQSLMTVYVLKDQLKELWFAPSEAEAKRRWREWYGMAMSSGIQPAIQFAKRLKGYLSGITASAVYRLNTSVLEGMNNKIKVIKRMAYGYRDNDYFFLKIKAAFPGKVR